MMGYDIYRAGALSYGWRSPGLSSLVGLASSSLAQQGLGSLVGLAKSSPSPHSLVGLAKSSPAPYPPVGLAASSPSGYPLVGLAASSLAGYGSGGGGVSGLIANNGLQRGLFSATSYRSWSFTAHGQSASPARPSWYASTQTFQTRRFLGAGFSY